MAAAPPSMGGVAVTTASDFDALGEVSSLPGSFRVFGAARLGMAGAQVEWQEKCPSPSPSNSQVEETPSPRGSMAAARP